MVVVVVRHRSQTEEALRAKSETGDTVSELFSPVSGEVVEINSKVVDSPEMVNADPHGDGWLIVVKMSDLSELDSLMSKAQYQAYLDKESEG